MKTINDVEYAFFADGPGGLKVVRLTPSTAITYQEPMAWSVETPGFARGVWVDDRYAYVADMDQGVHIIDPFAKQIRYTINAYAMSYDVAKDGDTLYVTDSVRGLLIYDLSIPLVPKLRGNIDTDWWGQEIVVADIANRKIAFVLDLVKTFLIDVSNPDYKDTTTAAVVAQNDRCGTIRALAKRGDLLYGVGGENFCTFRIAPNGVDLTLLQKLPVSGASMQDILLSPILNEAYVVDVRDGLLRFNITNPSAVSLLMRGLPNTTYNQAHKIALDRDGHYAFIADKKDFHVIRVYSTPPSVDEIFATDIAYESSLQDMAPTYRKSALALVRDKKLSFVYISDMPNFTFGGRVLTQFDFQKVAGFHRSPKIALYDSNGVLRLFSHDDPYVDSSLRLEAQTEARRETIASMQVAPLDESIVVRRITSGVDLFDSGSLEYIGGVNTFGYRGARMAFGDEGIIYVSDGEGGVAVVDTKLYEPIE
ncbi:MAG: hypothetical protein GXO16_00180 [Epsilonproteobacteria bacterium]|nr:hypothetical protein [Campylobacterota bacterium]